MELFANEGETVLSDRIFPSQESDRLEISARGNSPRIISLDIWKLRSAW